jgi:hypothetical protein
VYYPFGWAELGLPVAEAQACLVPMIYNQNTTAVITRALISLARG